MRLNQRVDQQISRENCTPQSSKGTTERIDRIRPGNGNTYPIRRRPKILGRTQQTQRECECPQITPDIRIPRPSAEKDSRDERKIGPPAKLEIELTFKCSHTISTASLFPRVCVVCRSLNYLEMLWACPEIKNGDKTPPCPE